MQIDELSQTLTEVRGLAYHIESALSEFSLAKANKSESDAIAAKARAKALAKQLTDIVAGFSTSFDTMETAPSPAVGMLNKYLDSRPTPRPVKNRVPA